MSYTSHACVTSTADNSLLVTDNLLCSTLLTINNSYLLQSHDPFPWGLAVHIPSVGHA